MVDVTCLKIDRNERLQWFWSTWEASQFCVLSRLRTPLGKPQDTFSTIESAIKQCLAALKNQDGENIVIKTASSSSKQGLFGHFSCYDEFWLVFFLRSIKWPCTLCSNSKYNLYYELSRSNAANRTGLGK